MYESKEYQFTADFRNHFNTFPVSVIHSLTKLTLASKYQLPPPITALRLLDLSKRDSAGPSLGPQAPSTNTTITFSSVVSTHIVTNDQNVKRGEQVLAFWIIRHFWPGMEPASSHSASMQEVPVIIAQYIVNIKEAAVFDGFPFRLMEKSSLCIWSIWVL